MLKVQFVDDEPWVLVGLERCINWEQEGFSIVAKCTSPTEGLEAIRLHDPDLVFTDIRMPGMSGIDMIRRAKQLGSHAEFVILSGYSEFSYAVAALQERSFEYLLKPIEKAKLEKVVAHFKETYKKKELLTRSLYTSFLLNNLLDNSLNLSSLFPQNDALLSTNKYQMAIIYENCRVQLEETLLSRIQHTAISLSPFKTLLVFQSEYDFSDCLCQSPLLVGVQTGISSTGMQNEAQRMMREANIAFWNSKFYNRGNPIMYRKDQLQPLYDWGIQLSHVTYHTSEGELKTLFDALLTTFIQQCVGVEGMEYVNAQFINLVRTKFPAANLAQDAEISNYEVLAQKYDGAEAFVLDLFSCLKHILNGQAAVPSRGSEIDLAISYLHSHMDQDISLADLAMQCGFSTVYMSDKFKRSTGKNFSKYLLDLRLETACRLLRTSTLTIAEIAEHVGIPNYYYFNKVFKKAFGVTPLQYKRGNGQP